MLIVRERLGNTEVITLNRPEAANSLNPPLMNELGLALQEILDDVEVRAIVVTGAGDRVFCAGMDLSALGDWNEHGPEAGERPGAGALADFMGGTYPKPLIAAVNGAAVGGGLELVMSCDLVVAADHARFGLPEVKRGLYAAGGGTLLATRIPQALALEMGLTGRLIDADLAERIGLVNHVVPAAEPAGYRHRAGRRGGGQRAAGRPTHEAADAGRRDRHRRRRDWPPPTSRPRCSPARMPARGRRHSWRSGRLCSPAGESAADPLSHTDPQIRRSGAGRSRPCRRWPAGFRPGRPPFRCCLR